MINISCGIKEVNKFLIKEFKGWYMLIHVYTSRSVGVSSYFWLCMLMITYWPEVILVY